MKPKDRNARLAIATLFAACLVSNLSGYAAENPSSPKGDNPPAQSKNAKQTTTTAATKDDVAALKQQLLEQQKEIEELRQALNQQKPVVEHLRQAASPAQPPKPTEVVAKPMNNIGQVASTTAIIPRALAQPENPSGEAAVAPALNAPPAAAAQPEQNLVKRVDTLEGEFGKLSDLAHGKIKIGATFYGFYASFPKTGFGPQNLDNTDIWPGPGNDGYNEFNINRTYINIYYTPTPALTFRVTPNVYRDTGGTTGEKLGSTSATGGNYNGNYGFRLKYAYVDWNNPFAHSEAFGKDKLTFGQEQQPLTDWEEGLYGYRFVNLTPWNYLSISSTYDGLKLHGPIEIKGKQYLDYEIGVFNNSSYHAYEVGDRKQVMARLSYYPFGAVSKYQGLGFTGFVDYGYKDAANEQNVTVPITRVAALVHYETKSGDDGIAGEFDWGRNAFSEANLFSGSGPADFFGLAKTPTPYAAFSSLAGAILSGTHTFQRGFDAFGHARIAKSPFYLFGMFENFQPNTSVSHNPLDFDTVIGGISYKFGKYWQFALDSKNVVYTHSQFTFPVSELSVLSPSLAATYPTGIPNVVPRDTNEISFNVLFNY